MYFFLKQLSARYCVTLIIAGLSFSCSQQEQHQIPALPDFDPSYYDYGLTVVNEIIDEDPDNAEAYYRRAELLLKQNKLNNALASIRKALELNDKDPLYHLISAKVHLQKGQNREAFSDAKASLKYGGASVELYEILAQASLNSNYFTDAMLYSDSALALAPNNPYNYLMKGKALASRKDTAAAEPQLLKSLELGAEKADVYEALVEMYMNTQDYNKARRYMDKNLAYQKGEVSDRILFQQAKILQRVGNIDSASTILYQIKDEGNVDLFSLNKELMHLYYQKNWYDSADFYADQMLTFRPNDKEALITQARIYNNRRNYQQSIAKYEEILEKDSLQQQELYKLASDELDYLRRKVAYLWQKQQEEQFEKMKKGLAPLQPITPDEPENK
ncbi:tetratricopeptide (TPR) repeat protein [Catalinimonas alkaloidigena]|uniref:tetratricopeptide repeat protein n=1 Tax=Catalinimonas alkaloidigena TaxID=1075417 RepID=UPI002404B648|nr:tetratricopeptide repeat protein [Catalinimonas alkaloidigena]MDF9796780.1 tetratricopeptide (TPR) repeat protein [Catalinimonas alkaloidigena]